MGEPEQRFSSTCSRTEKLLPAWATMCGSCAHPDQSPLLARAALLRNDLWVRTSTAILLFFILGGVAIHDCLLSSLCYPINQGVFEFESRIRSVLLIVLQNEEPPGTERLKEIASFLHAYASQSFPPEKDISEERKRTYQWISDAYLAHDVVVQSMFDLLRGTALEDSASRIRNYRLVGKMLAMLIDSLSRTNLQVELEDVVDSASLIWQSDEDLLTLLQKNRDMFDETTQILTCAVADWLLHGSPSSQSKDKESWIIRAHCSRQ